MGLTHSLSEYNWISVVLVIIICISVLQGIGRGGRSSARYLFFMVSEGIFTVIGALLAWKAAEWLSPLLQDWLNSRHIQIPDGTRGWGGQIYYTLVTGIRDFPLLRFGLLFLILYAVIKQTISWIWMLASGSWHAFSSAERRGGFSFASALTGGVIGAMIGAARALMAIAVLFIYVTLVPQGPFASYIQASNMYQQGATHIIQPFTGDFVSKRLPVFTRSVSSEFQHILERRYDIIDRNIPDNIQAAAGIVTKGDTTDAAKARDLYRWVGTRIHYDEHKYNLYVQKGVWEEQTPEDTFQTRKGVCIDYSRLYAVMARSVGLKVRVVTGLGYDGRGSYGSHAWNEVYLSGEGKWVPLDTTWVSSGGNWFDPPNFYRTHIKET